MDKEMSVASPCLVDRWIEENTTIIKKWKQCIRGREVNRDLRKQCHIESLKLLQKIQGVPAVTDQVQLELTVVYNTLLFSLSYSKLSGIEEHLTDSLVRALDAVGCQAPHYDLVALWHVALKTLGSTVYLSCVHQLLCVQWALWLSTGSLDKIHDFLLQVNLQKEMTSPSEGLLAVTRDLRLSTGENASLSVAMATKEFKDLLHICTVIALGIEKMKQEKFSEALLAFLEATTLPAPRPLLAQVYTLTGLSYAKLSQLQSALQCYRKALEVDFHCQSALHHSSLVYRQLGNTQAEIEALRLLHSAATMLQTGDVSSSARVPLISPAVLLCGEHQTFISTTPPPLPILHTLAHTCVLHERISEAAEYYLDLLASLQSDRNQLIPTEGSTSLPRIPVIYLEAAFTMLKARRHWDAVAICEEVIVKTVDLIPERIVLDLPVEEQLPGSEVPSPPQTVVTGKGTDAAVERLDCVLWAGAAYLLQAQVYHQMKESKEALTNFTRSINLLVKVCTKHKAGMVSDAVGIQVQTLQKLKGLAFAGRGVCFTDRGQLKEALRDFQLSLQASPGCKITEIWLVEVLWRLGRKEEATVYWRETHISTKAPSSGDLPLYLQVYSQDGLSFDPNGLKRKMNEFVHSRGVTT